MSGEGRLFKTQCRVRYSETDRMGYCYYGNFAAYFEVGRVEALRSLGFSYKKIEDEGLLLPVLDYSVRYLKPAHYDELLTLETRVVKVTETRVYFAYRCFNELGELLNTASTTLVFVSASTKKPTAGPAAMLLTLQSILSPE